jgi:hypothetical protein
MSTTTTPAPDSAASFSDFATYCPEDNKLRLYVGRVPRPEYLQLRAAGWISTPKQHCDFVAVWTPGRRDTALDYCGAILDEDQSPADRAADRAARFAGYLEKRTAEATGHADRFDAGPSAHGFQNLARAERSAARHDRTAAHACDAWAKAEYWQTRTAGVIAHALHVSAPAVRMGRIKELESEIRKYEKMYARDASDRKNWLECAAVPDPATQYARAVFLAQVSAHCGGFPHPRPSEVSSELVRAQGSSLLSLLTLSDQGRGVSITGAEAAALYLLRDSAHSSPSAWFSHLNLRLAYENQMLEAQGGRAGSVEIEAGGFLRGGRHLSNIERQIFKVNRSPASGRVVSVCVRDPRPSLVNLYGNPFKDGVARCLSHSVAMERLGPDVYRAPTDAERAAFAALIQAEKARARAEKIPCPLINPTDADAARLLALWNSARRDYHEACNPYQTPKARADYSATFVASNLIPSTQAAYSLAARSTYGRAGSREICSLGRLVAHAAWSDRHNQAARALTHGPALCSVRCSRYDPHHLIILTDKPQKPLPAAVWLPFVAPTPAAAPTPLPEALPGLA